MKKYETAFIEVIRLGNDIIVMSDIGLKEDNGGLSGEAPDRWL